MKIANRLSPLLNCHTQNTQQTPSVSNWFQTGETKASEFSGVCETTPPLWHHLRIVTATVCSMEINRRILWISHLWNNLFTLVWLHPAGQAASWSFSVSLALFHTSTSALLCTMIFSSQPLFFPGNGILLELDMLRLKYDGLALSWNSKALWWWLSLVEPCIFWDDEGYLTSPLHSEKGECMW